MILSGVVASSGPGVIQYWLSTLQGTGFTNQVAADVAVDKFENVYTVATSNQSGNNDMEFAKYSKNGSTLLQRRFGGAGSDQPNAVAVDNQNNFYIGGAPFLSGIGQRAYIAKYNENANPIWQRFIVGSAFGSIRRIKIDSAYNVYVGGSIDSRAYVAKYNSDGALLWQRRFTDATTSLLNGLDIDAIGNVYISAIHGSTRLLVAKYNTDGIIQWQRTLGDQADFSFSLGGCAVDSTGSVYSSASDSSGLVLVKYNTDGVLQWQKRLSSGGTQPNGSIYTDQYDGVYAAFTSAAADWALAKYNSSGTLLWQRVLRTSLTDTANSIYVDSNRTIYIAGRTFINGEQPDALVAKLPGDGSLTGTYTLSGQSYIYEPSSFSDTTTSFTSTSSSLSEAAATFTSQSTTLTSNTTSVTASTVTIGQVS